MKLCFCMLLSLAPSLFRLEVMVQKPRGKAVAWSLAHAYSFRHQMSRNSRKCLRQITSYFLKIYIFPLLQALGLGETRRKCLNRCQPLFIVVFTKVKPLLNSRICKMCLFFFLQSCHDFCTTHLVGYCRGLK